MKRFLRAINHYIVFFLMIAFVITCCTMLFVTLLTDSLNVTLTDENLTAAAKLTFLNTALLALLFTVIDSMRRKYTVDRPAKSIVDAAQKLMQGDFSARVKPIRRFSSDDSFAAVIDCFNQMAEELGSVETLRTDFIANVSHELKTPLTVIQNYGTLLQSPDLSEQERAEYANGISNTAKRMAEMVTNILKLNRLENQQIYPQITEFDLGEQLCECLLQFESVWERNQIEIKTDIAENVRVRADAELLTLVWNNLLSNAFKFTEAVGSVSLTLTATDHHAIVQVKDTGCGMSPEVGAHIFEKFYQGDPSHAARGNGLGLALVKRVIGIQQGEIHVESIVGKGSTFTVKIRRCP